jgi:hypothetical protein
MLTPVCTAKVLLIVDASVNSALPPDRLDLLEIAEVVVLDANRNGVEQITGVLAHFAQVSRLQIIAQARPGALRLGSVQLDYANLETYSREIEAWRQFLAPGARILFGSSTVATGIEGMKLMGQLSQITGALVAAVNVSHSYSDLDIA